MTRVFAGPQGSLDASKGPEGGGAAPSSRQQEILSSVCNDDDVIDAIGRGVAEATGEERLQGARSPLPIPVPRGSGHLKAKGPLPPRRGPYSLSWPYGMLTLCNRRVGCLRGEEPPPLSGPTARGSGPLRSGRNPVPPADQLAKHI